MKSLPRIPLMAGLTCSFATVTQAHPGHGEVGPTHYVTSPEHWAQMLATGLVCLLIFWATGRFARRRAKA